VSRQGLRPLEYWGLEFLLVGVSMFSLYAEACDVSAPCTRRNTFKITSDRYLWNRLTKKNRILYKKQIQYVHVLVREQKCCITSYKNQIHIIPKSDTSLITFKRAKPFFTRQLSRWLSHLYILLILNGHYWCQVVLVLIHRRSLSCFNFLIHVTSQSGISEPFYGTLNTHVRSNSYTSPTGRRQ
jgi:hypothetical protein